MKEKISREEKKREKVLDKARESIRALAKMRDNSEKVRNLTGDEVTDNMKAQYLDQMKEVARENGLDLEAVLAGKEDTLARATETAPGKESPQEGSVAKENRENTEKSRKEERAAAQAKTEIELLLNRYKSTEIAMERDPYARAAMQGNLDRIKGKLLELAETSGLGKAEILAKLHGATPEELRRAGIAKLEKLAIEKKTHETQVTYGDPESRHRLLEIENKALGVIKEHGLPISHIEPFRVPAMPPELEQALAEVPAEDAAALDQEAGILITENTPATKGEKRSFFKKLFGGNKEEKQKKKEAAEREAALETIRKSREKYRDMQVLIAETDADSPLIGDLKKTLKGIERDARESILRMDPSDRTAQNIGPFMSLLDHPAEMPPSSSGEKTDQYHFTPAKEETRFEKLKRGFRKYFTVGLFTAAAVSKPLPTSDIRSMNEREETKTEIAYESPIDRTLADRQKADEHAFMAAHTKMEIERKAGETHERAPETRTERTSVKKERGGETTLPSTRPHEREHEEIAPLEPLSLHMLSLRNAKDSAHAEMVTPIGLDTAGFAAASGTGTAKENEARSTRPAVEIGRLDAAPLREMKTPAAKPGKMSEQVRRLAEEERKIQPSEAMEKVSPAALVLAPEIAPVQEMRTGAPEMPMPEMNTAEADTLVRMAPEVPAIWEPGAEPAPEKAAPEKFERASKTRGRIKVDYIDPDDVPNIVWNPKPAKTAADTLSTESNARAAGGLMDKVYKIAPEKKADTTRPEFKQSIPEELEARFRPDGTEKKEGFKHPEALDWKGRSNAKKMMEGGEKLPAILAYHTDSAAWHKLVIEYKDLDAKRTYLEQVERNENIGPWAMALKSRGVTLLFNSENKLAAEVPFLFGESRGDSLNTYTTQGNPEGKTTPAGSYFLVAPNKKEKAALKEFGHDKEPVLWQMVKVNPDGTFVNQGIALHGEISGNAEEQEAGIHSEAPEEHHQSIGCIRLDKEALKIMQNSLKGKNAYKLYILSEDKLASLNTETGQIEKVSSESEVAKKIAEGVDKYVADHPVDYYVIEETATPETYGAKQVVKSIEDPKAPQKIVPAAAENKKIKVPTFIKRR